jgi:uncharacterized damage-inducible protein DinB
MHPTISSVSGIYELNTSLLPRTLNGIKDEDLVKRPTDCTNSLHFVVGHTAATRFYVGNFLGLDGPCPWGEIFDGGQTVRDISEYPSMTEILQVWNEYAERLQAGFEEVSQSHLESDSPVQLPGGSTVRGAISFFAFHESYHIGQLAYIRRLLEYDQAFG